MGVVILREGGVVLEEVNSWNQISIDLTHQLDTPPDFRHNGTDIPRTAAGTEWINVWLKYIDFL